MMYVLFNLKCLSCMTILVTIYFQEIESDEKGTYYKSNQSNNILCLQTKSLFKNSIRKRLNNMPQKCCLSFFKLVLHA